MKTILSTRKLSTSQRDLILGRGHSVIDYSAIQITPLDFQVQDQIDNVIFTSVNAVTIFFEKKANKVDLGEIFCVGDKTEQKLTEYGQKVTKKAQNWISWSLLFVIYGNCIFYVGAVFAPNRGLAIGDNAAGEGNLAGAIAFVPAVAAAYVLLLVIFYMLPRLKKATD